MNLAQDRVTGLWYRPRTWDLDAIRRADEFARCVEPGDVVLDIGSHVGSTVRIAVEAGAGLVVAYEPHPESFKVLAKNFGPDTPWIAHISEIGAATPVVLHDAAVVAAVAVSRSTGKSTLYENPNSTIGHTGMTKAWTAKAKSYPVAIVRFADACAIDGLNVIKIDAEGAETTYDFMDVPETVRCMQVEFHMRGPATWPKMAIDAYNGIVELGWFPNAPAPNSAVEWNCTHVFRR